jgi:uroporphyrinogen III methyltransferase/synthase
MSLLQNTTHPKPGCVYLIGAGPSDPALLTLRAHELLAGCDVIAYDALIAPLLLTYSGSRAELIMVGYRGCDGKQPYGMHPTVIEKALAGKSVARIKSGDPAIFSRLAQEIDDLKQHGIPYEIIPGISSANAASAYLGIPLTHRHVASEVMFVSGHDLHRDPEKQQTSWKNVCATTGTLVLYMGASKLEMSCQRLIAYGKEEATPAALVTSIGMPGQRVVFGTLATLAAKAAPFAAEKAPGLVIVGEAVALHQQYAWMNERKPLFGLSILLATSCDHDGELARSLRELGAAVYLAAHVHHQKSREAVIPRKLGAVYQVVGFADPHSFASFLRQFADEKRDLRELCSVKLLALTPQTAQAMDKAALPADLLGKAELVKFISANSAQTPPRPLKTVIFSSELEAAEIAASLQDASAPVDMIPMYQHCCQFHLARAVNINLTLFTDALAMRLLLGEPEWQQREADIPVLILEHEADFDQGENAAGPQSLQDKLPSSIWQKLRQHAHQIDFATRQDLAMHLVSRKTELMKRGSM